MDLTPFGLVTAVGEPWHGEGWNLGALAALAGVSVVTDTLAAVRLARR